MDALPPSSRPRTPTRRSGGRSFASTGRSRGTTAGRRRHPTSLTSPPASGRTGASTATWAQFSGRVAWPSSTSTAPTPTRRWPGSWARCPRRRPCAPGPGACTSTTATLAGSRSVPATASSSASARISASCRRVSTRTPGNRTPGSPVGRPGSRTCSAPGRARRLLRRRRGQTRPGARDWRDHSRGHTERGAGIAGGLDAPPWCVRNRDSRCARGRQPRPLPAAAPV